MLDNTICTMYIPNVFEINEFLFNEVTSNTCGHKLAFLTHLFKKRQISTKVQELQITFLCTTKKAFETYCMKFTLVT
jgi:hypothetical protein